MGQKVNPHGLRVGVIKDWDSRWYAEADFADNLVEDHKIRTFLKKKLYSAGVSKIEIERASDKVKIILYTAKPGVVIGKGGAEIEKTKAQVQKLTDKKVFVDIKEVKRPDRDAQLVAENIAQQLENRISFRRAMKSAMGRTMKAGAKGIKASVVMTECHGLIYLSARSIDEVNVQVMMEKLGGGGHRTIAGAQLSGISMEEAKDRVKAVIDEMLQKGDIS